MADANFRTPDIGLIIAEVQPTVEDLMAAGNLLRGKIRERCFNDEDLRGGQFIPYSASYAKRKGQQNVDLFSRGPSNHMLNALEARVPPEANLIEVGIYGDEELATRAQIHDQGGTGRTRQGTGKTVAKRKSRQFGADIRKQKKGGKPTFDMPQRQFMGATQQDLDEMQRLVVDLIKIRLEQNL